MSDSDFPISPGYCQCGCGGRPLGGRFLRGHHRRTRPKGHDPNPEGLCRCGCGGTVPIAQRSVPKRGIEKGGHCLFIPGHQTIGRTFKPVPQLPNPSGLCMCGCGEQTEMALFTDRRIGTVKDQPQRFVKGHHLRGAPEPYAVDPETGCWEWRWARNQQGYGQIKIKGKTTAAHRHYYALHKGAIPSGLQIDHLCRNRACVNPSHLEAVTPAVNQRRSQAKLTEEDAAAIRVETARGVTQVELARRFGVHTSTVNCVVRGLSWRE